MKTFLLLSLFCLSLFSVADDTYLFKEIPFQKKMNLSGKTLTLNGVGVRTKLFWDVYVAALYVEELSEDSKKILESNSIKHLTMEFLRDVDADQIKKAWDEGFNNNIIDEKRGLLRPYLEEVKKGITSNVVKGEKIVITFYPTQVLFTFKTNNPITINHDQFPQALLSIWLGENPPSESLKKDLIKGVSLSPIAH